MGFIEGECVSKLPIKNISLKGVIKSWTLSAIILCTELLQVHTKSYTLYMAVNKDFKYHKTNRPELDDLQNTNL